MGLPRSGSDSIHEFFRCHNISSAHYCCDSNHNDQQQKFKDTTSRIRFPCTNTSRTCGQCVYENMIQGNLPFDRCTPGSGSSRSDTPVLQVYSQFDVETGQPFSWFLPQHYMLPLLYESYPNNSIWILNYRTNAEIWANNILHWYSVTKRFFHAFHLDYYDEVNNHDDPTKRKHKVLLAPKRDLSQSVLEKELEISYQRAYSIKQHERRKHLLMDIYKKHLQKVKLFAQQYHIPLFEINVDDPTIEKKMTEYFFSRNNQQSHNSDINPQRRDTTCWKFNSTKLDNDYKDFSSLFVRQ
jgi:hypothetical protein